MKQGNEHQIVDEVRGLLQVFEDIVAAGQGAEFQALKERVVSEHFEMRDLIQNDFSKGLRLPAFQV